MRWKTVALRTAEITGAAWKPLEWALTKLEHLEFVSDREHLKKAMEVITDAPAWIGWLIPIVGIGLIIWDVFFRTKAQPASSAAATLYPHLSGPWWKRLFAGGCPQSNQGFIPLRDAMVNLLTALEDQRSIWLKFVDSNAEHPEDRLVNLARMFTGEKPLFGDKEPTKKREQIPQFSVKMGEFFNRGARFRHAGNVWENLCVRISDLEEMKDRMCRMSAPDPDAEAQELFERAYHKIQGDRDGALLDLVKLRARGVRLRNEIPTSLPTADLGAWIDHVNEWARDVIDTLQTVSAADATWFETLDTVPPARVAIPNIRLGGREDRARFQAAFCQHDCRLARLDGLLQKHGVGTNTP